jgi:AcrR family transcriptional regulator
MRATPMRADALANRGRLLLAAHAVFRERGLGAEMKEIAQRAGVSIGTIYRNFPTRDDLVVAMVGELLGEMRENADAATAVDDPVEALRVFLRGGFAIAERFGDLAVLHGVLPAACHALVQEFDMVSRAGALVRRGVEAGVLRADLDFEFVAARLVSSFDPKLYRRLRTSRSDEELIDESLRFFLRGAAVSP